MANNMRFGVREIADVTFRPLTATDIGNQHFEAMQPCLYIDSATTSTIETAATTVYAQGGKGNARLIAWEGEKTVTFTVTDALLSPISFAMLSGAGVVDYSKNTGYVHQVVDSILGADGKTVDLAGLLEGELANDDDHPVYAVLMDSNGTIVNYLGKGEFTVTSTAGSEQIVLTTVDAEHKSCPVRVDCYVKSSFPVQEIEIDASTFAGSYYIEADTLFRDEATGKDFPANFIIPKGKIQTNFTFTMAASGDPSTFDFKIDALPAYTINNRKKKVLYTLQVVDNITDEAHDYSTPIADHTTAKPKPETDSGSH